jgi:hypothetical protein
MWPVDPVMRNTVDPFEIGQVYRLIDRGETG